MKRVSYKELAEEAQKQGVQRYVVGAVIAKDSTILILQRPKEDFMGGIYELPSGKVEEGETLDMALNREVEEETGLKIKEIINYIGSFDYESKSGKKTRQFNFAVAVHEPLEIKLSEHDNYAFVDRNKLGQYSVTESVRNIIGLFWGNK